MSDFSALRADMQRLAQMPAANLPASAARTFEAFLDGLNTGAIRAALRQPDGQWQTQAWVKHGILLGFRLGHLAEVPGTPAPFFDKHTYPLKPLTLADEVRLVPGGSSVRTGAYLAPSVVCMPPMYVNVGAYIDAGTMIDSHALVGSCAQIGKRVHLAAAAQVGGVLEPVGAQPVIIEDDVFIGGGCGVYEGCLIRERAVLAPGVVLTGATRLYDLARSRLLIRTAEAPLEVPAGAVVVPGSRALPSVFAQQHGLSAYVPLIVKYRDAGTDAATALESALR